MIKYLIYIKNILINFNNIIKHTKASDEQGKPSLVLVFLHEHVLRLLSHVQSPSFVPSMHRYEYVHLNIKAISNKPISKRLVIPKLMSILITGM